MMEMTELSKTSIVSTEALLVYGLSRVGQTKDGIVGAVCIDRGKLEGK